MDLRRAYETICDENERLRVPGEPGLTTDGQIQDDRRLPVCPAGDRSPASAHSFHTFPVHYQVSGPGLPVD